MSRRKREKTKLKQKRHQNKQKNGTLHAGETAGGHDVAGAFPANSPHLQGMSPAWQQFYAAVSKAVAE
ncbi:hypothetical protein [Effusibacillus pohliae]|uniref:hypothetical protein n=1 Tax=Effusibacillus pohliae TaxID=232270 RepID=UPI000370482B|nr:hypothetical protein [Effusibacillus pohliae]